MSASFTKRENILPVEMAALLSFRFCVAQPSFVDTPTVWRHCRPHGGRRMSLSWDACAQTALSSGTDETRPPRDDSREAP